MQSAEQHRIRRLLVKGDSELVIKQMKGEMQVHSPQLKTFYNRAGGAAEFLCGLRACVLRLQPNGSIISTLDARATATAILMLGRQLRSNCYRA